MNPAAYLWLPKIRFAKESKINFSQRWPFSKTIGWVVVTENLVSTVCLSGLLFMFN